MRAYFLGIAGAGMSALASILAAEGWDISGSDAGVFPPVTDYLDRMRIAWRDGFDARLLPADLDAAIVGGSAKLALASNPEWAELKRRGVPLWSFPEFLGRHIAGRDGILVAGSFGKSTLTALLAVLLRQTGRDPGYFIGAAPLDLESSGYPGTDPIFLVEADEYITSETDRRPKFLHYPAGSLLVSSLVHDHLNVYPTMASYEAAFAALIDRLPPDHPLVCAHAFEPLRRLTAGRPVVWYGREPCLGYHAEAVEIGEITRFRLVTPAGDRVALSTELLGLHNIENIVGAAALLLERGDIDEGALVDGVRRFRGVARRLDKKTRRSRVPAYEGFGSSYEKARSAIEALALHFPDRPLWVVFEPHTFSWRNAASLAWYDTVFAGVARVLLLPPPTHGAEGHDQLAGNQILARIRAAGIQAELCGSPANVLWVCERDLAGDEVLLLLSSGPLGGLTTTLPALLESRFG